MEISKIFILYGAQLLSNLLSDKTSTDCRRLGTFTQPKLEGQLANKPFTHAASCAEPTTFVLVVVVFCMICSISRPSHRQTLEHLVACFPQTICCNDPNKFAALLWSVAQLFLHNSNFFEKVTGPCRLPVANDPIEIRVGKFAGCPLNLLCSISSAFLKVGFFVESWV